MNTDEIFAEIDRLYENGEGGRVEEFILDNLSEAARLGDENAMIQLLNELIGHYRETGEFDKMKTFAGKLLDILEGSSLKGSMAHATSLLNIANAYRAAGMLRESNKLYQEVKSYYDANVAPDSMLYASLLNNMALLFQEMNDHESAADCLERALGISLNYKECRIEQASTYTNLAATLIKLGRLDEAEQHLLRAFELFEEDEDPDYHYSAALSGMAEICYLRRDYDRSIEYYEKALVQIEKAVGRSHAYEITKQNMEAAIRARESVSCSSETATDASRLDAPLSVSSGFKQDSDGTGPSGARRATSGPVSIESVTGLQLARAYYEQYGRPMIREKFAEYEDRIAVGLVGEGSECFGFDDETSRDHDFGPGFCMWLAKDDYKKIGKRLQKEYDRLPKEFMGYRRLETEKAGKRVGVFTVGKFYKQFLGLKRAPKTDEEWLSIPESGLAHAVNGEVFCDGLGGFSFIRNSIKGYYPDSVWRRRIAQSAALMSQSGQYNYPRMLGRGDVVTASVYMSEFVRNTMKMLYLLNRHYAPYDKWMYKGLDKLEDTGEIPEKLGQLSNLGPKNAYAKVIIEDICTDVLKMMSDRGLAENNDNYLDHHVYEIIYGKDQAPSRKKSAPTPKSNRADKYELIDRIISLEWNAFDKVKNQGGRASCQDDLQTFSVMRKSQYMLWDNEMLKSFIADFEEANEKGWNLITEKYGRMEETTAPEEYEKIKDSLPPVSSEKKQIIEAIVAIQVGMMEEFAARFPKAAGEARSIHTSEDTPYNTSYETYLRGEITTYSDETLALYGRFVAKMAQEGRNIAEETITNSAIMYGYESLEAMEAKL